jgi:hypothetical protein
MCRHDGTRMQGSSEKRPPNGGSRPPGSHGRQFAIGLALGLGTVVLAALLEGARHTLFAGVLLGAIGAIYFGFAVADGRPSAIAVQAASASAFALIAYLGVENASDVLLGIGYAAHAGWDVVHHEGRGPTRVRSWYPPFCAVFDLVVAVPLLAGWL